MLRTIPSGLVAEEQKECPKSCRLYLVEIGTEEKIYLTNHDQDVVVTGLPAAKGDDPQTFTACAIDNSAIESSSEIGSNNMRLVVEMNGTDFASSLIAMLLSMPGDKIVVTIYRAASAAMPGPLEYTSHLYAVWKGLATNFTPQGPSLNVEMVALTLQAQSEIPRFRDSKLCQHVLYEGYCTADRTASENRVTTVLSAVNQRFRYVEITDTLLGGATMTALRMQGGDIWVTDATRTQVLGKVSIIAVEVLPASAGIRFYLGWWFDAIVAGAYVFVHKGCRKTLTACEDEFENTDNFGGAPWIPDVSPAVHGVKA